MLILFKYTGFFIENLNNWFSLSIPVPNFPLPIGISFYTFRAVSYIVDCYWGKVEAEQKFSRFLLYMTFFPVIMQGPIARYETMQNQLAVRRCNPSDLYEGMMRVIIGLGKKVIIADNLGNIVDQFLANGNIEQQTTLGAWYGVIVYAMQIYFDFSGYSDMAIGIARMMGFQLEENFRHPFLCKDITEFWQRWHISLGTFFRDYVLYIPIFGKRRKYGGLFLVWFCTGLWHGASWNFVLWGLIFFVLLTIERLGLGKLLAKTKVLKHIYVIFLIPLTWVVFALPNMQDIATYFSRLFPFFADNTASFVNTKDVIRALHDYWYLLIACVVFCLPFPSRWYEKHKNSKLVILGLVLIYLMSVYKMQTQTSNPFLYYQF